MKPKDFTLTNTSPKSHSDSQEKSGRSSNFEMFAERTLNKFFIKQKKMKSIAAGKIEQLSNELQQREREVNTANIEIAGMNKKLAERLAENQSLTEKYSNMENQVEAIKQELQTLKETHQNLEITYDKNLKRNNEEFNILKLNHETAEKNIKTLIEELTAKKDEVSILSHKVEVAEQKTLSLEKELTEKIKSYDMLENECKQANEEAMVVLKEKIELLEKTIETKESLIADNDKGLAEKNRIIQNQADKIAAIERTLVQPITRIPPNIKGLSSSNVAASQHDNNTVDLVTEDNKNDDRSPVQITPLKRAKSKNKSSQLLFSTRSAIDVEKPSLGKRRRQPKRYDDFVSDTSSDSYDENPPFKKPFRSSIDQDPNSQILSDSTIDPFEKLKNL